MKWIRRVLSGLVVVVAASVVAAFAVALHGPGPAGFQLVRSVGADGRPLSIGLWYPTGARPWPTTFFGLNLMNVARDAPVAGDRLPLVVLSHGNGGGPASHADLALALAGQGFVVAAPLHAGDNYADQSAGSSPDLFAGRTREVHSTIDYVLARWPAHARVDATRVGVFGFSAGGFTALAAIGGAPDLRRLAPHCATAPEFACRLLAQAHSPLVDGRELPPPEAYARDRRIRAAVVAAPGLGFTFTPEGLAATRIPVQIWTGTADTNVPTATNAAPVRDALGARAEYHEVPGAAHFSFLAPCRLGGPAPLCGDAGDFDRRRFHDRMNEDVVRFFRSTL